MTALIPVKNDPVSIKELSLSALTCTLQLRLDSWVVDRVKKLVFTIALIHPGSSKDQLESDILPFPLNDELSSGETEKLELSLRNYKAETNCVKTDAQILEHFDEVESESIVTSVNLGLTKTALVSVSPCDLTSFIT